MFKYFIIAILLIVCSCNTSNRSKLRMVEAVDSNYIKSKRINKNAKDSLFYYFVNNPYGWTKDDKVIIYLDDSITFVGEFHVFLKGACNKKIIKEKTQFRLFIISNNGLYIFQNKYLINWNDSFSHVYIGLFPDNPAVDKIYFFPQVEPLL